MPLKSKILIGVFGFVFILASSIPSICATVTYTYDNLNRLAKVTYENGVTEEFTYDAAGNRLSLEVAYEIESPSLAIASHTNGQHLNSSDVTICGTASDAGKWGNGISQILVNGVRAHNDTAIGGETANWCIQLTLNPGANAITIMAYDNSGNQNSTIETFSLYYDEQTKIYLPLILR